MFFRVIVLKGLYKGLYKGVELAALHRICKEVSLLLVRCLLVTLLTSHFEPGWNGHCHEGILRKRALHGLTETVQPLRHGGRAARSDAVPADFAAAWRALPGRASRERLLRRGLPAWLSRSKLRTVCEDAGACEDE